MKLEEVPTTLKEFRAAHDQAKALQMTLPALEVTFDGQSHLLSSSLAIATYIAQTHKPELLGKTPFEQAQVDMWLEVLRSELQPLTRTVVYQALGHVKCDTNEHQYVYGLLKEALKTPNNHLKGKTYFVGGALTLVDVFFTLLQQELQQAVLDTNYRNSMSNINSHFKTMAANEAVRGRCGALKQGKKQIVPFLLGESDQVAAGKDLNKAQKKENSKQKSTKQ